MTDMPPQIFLALRQTVKDKIEQLKEHRAQVLAETAAEQKKHLTLLQESCPHSLVFEVREYEFLGEAYYGIASTYYPGKRACALCGLVEENGYSTRDRQIHHFNKLAKRSVAQSYDFGNSPAWFGTLPDLESIAESKRVLKKDAAS
ncbi:MAG: hypothetical protein HYT30_01905 [Parcubacteria group bacterium]|nr:hypothetical protein [Parcubacteria group bacterium]